MKQGTYSVTVSGFLTKDEAEDYARAARESQDEGELDADVTEPETKSFRVQEAERGSTPSTTAEA